MSGLKRILLVLWLAVPFAGAALAQTVEFQGQPVQSIPAPRNDKGTEQAARLGALGLQAKLAYVPDLKAKVEQKAPAKRSDDAPSAAPMSGPVAMVLVLVVLAVALGTWVYVSGAPLLSQNPDAAVKKPQQVPQGWAQSAGDLAGSGSLADIAAMTDRRAALVRLLRLCLLKGGQATGTSFRRSDTEREALRRLPGSWHGSPYLRGLLTAAELAHYGGRPVAEDEFRHLIDGAAAIVPRGGQHG